MRFAGLLPVPFSLWGRHGTHTDTFRMRITPPHGTCCQPESTREKESLFFLFVCLYLFTLWAGRRVRAVAGQLFFSYPQKRRSKAGAHQHGKPFTWHQPRHLSSPTDDSSDRPQWKRKKLLLLLFLSFGNCRIKSNEIQLTEKKETTAAANPSINGPSSIWIWPATVFLFFSYEKLGNDEWSTDFYFLFYFI
jgi:hypothetical protein